mmetsp:Transcript_57676/g.167413  ORF Transcript_57676/g.167413 Transcript_57676/m.167413 type:complete len:203 (+) Transcript_57676:439-1047(+)
MREHVVAEGCLARRAGGPTGVREDPCALRRAGACPMGLLGPFSRRGVRRRRCSCAGHGPGHVGGRAGGQRQALLRRGSAGHLAVDVEAGASAEIDVARRGCHLAQTGPGPWRQRCLAAVFGGRRWPNGACLRTVLGCRVPFRGRRHQGVAPPDGAHMVPAAERGRTARGAAARGDAPLTVRQGQALGPRGIVPAGRRALPRS